MINIEKIDFNSANSVIEKCNSPHYGIHLAIRKSDMYPDMNDKDIYERMCKQIQIFKKNLLVPLLLENSHDHEVFDLYPYNMQEQINRIIIDYWSVSWYTIIVKEG